MNAPLPLTLASGSSLRRREEIAAMHAVKVIDDSGQLGHLKRECLVTP